MIALRLADKVEKGGLLRLHSNFRPEEEVLGRGKLIPVSQLLPNSRFGMPTRERCEKSDIIIATCATSGWLKEAYSSLKFDCVVIDEATQATEPETLVPLTFATSSECGVLVCGDPKQLGPNLRSHHAIKLGLGSLLERLEKRKFYQEGEPGETLKIVLTKNYRAHPDLMALSSRMFYDSQIVSCRDPREASEMLAFKDIGGSEFPLLFYGCNGKDEREGVSSLSIVQRRNSLKSKNTRNHLLFGTWWKFLKSLVSLNLFSTAVTSTFR